MISIVWIGYSLDPDLAAHSNLINQKVHRSISEFQNDDKSRLFNRYVLTSDGQPICLNEYATRIANYKNVHVVELDSIQNDYLLREHHIDFDCNWNELVLKDRQGRSNLTLVQDCDFKELKESIHHMKQTHERIVFLIPYHLEKAFQKVK